MGKQIYVIIFLFVLFLGLLISRKTRFLGVLNLLAVLFLGGLFFLSEQNPDMFSSLMMAYQNEIGIAYLVCLGITLFAYSIAGGWPLLHIFLYRYDRPTPEKGKILFLVLKYLRVIVAFTLIPILIVAWFWQFYPNFEISTQYFSISTSQLLETIVFIPGIFIALSAWVVFWSPLFFFGWMFADQIDSGFGGDGDFDFDIDFQDRKYRH